MKRISMLLAAAFTIAVAFACAVADEFPPLNARPPAPVDLGETSTTFFKAQRGGQVALRQIDRRGGTTFYKDSTGTYGSAYTGR